jgi:hypothetical protein
MRLTDELKPKGLAVFLVKITNGDRIHCTDLRSRCHVATLSQNTITDKSGKYWN